MARKKIKKICKKHYWHFYSVCPICGLELKVTQTGDSANYEFLIDIPMAIKPIERKSGIVTLKTYEDEKRN